MKLPRVLTDPNGRIATIALGLFLIVVIVFGWLNGWWE